MTDQTPNPWGATLPDAPTPSTFPAPVVTAQSSTSPSSESTPPASGVAPAVASANRHKHVAWMFVALALACALVGVLATGGFLFFRSSQKKGTLDTAFEIAAVTEALGESTSNELSVNVAREVLPSVVSIATESNAGEGSGSGVIIKEDGYILTNNHVIENGGNIEVTAGANTYPAKIVGVDSSTDLAVLKIDETELPVIKFGESANLEVGQYVMAVGSPFGLAKSVSVGIISGIGESRAMASSTGLSAYANLIQTDAAINPGNSGGALVDADARLIGINTLITTTSGSNAGVGFAIPADTALDIATQLIDGGKAVHPFLGVSTQSVDKSSATQFKMATDSGAYIVEVVADSPAKKAGLEKGDIIVKIGDDKVASSEDVFTAVRSHKPGDKVKITFFRGDKEQTVEATLVSDENVAQSNSNPGSGSATTMQPDALGAEPHSGFTPEQLLDMLRELYGQ